MIGEEGPDEIAYWAAREERDRIIASLVRGELKILGKPVALSWPEGQPLHLEQMLERMTRGPVNAAAPPDPTR